MPTDATNASVENPLAALLESELIGCAEADPKLSRNYKSEFSESLWTKHAQQASIEQYHQGRFGVL